MKASLRSFICGLEDLRNYITELELESELFSSQVNEMAPMDYEYILLRLQEHVFNENVKKRRFNYNTIIISLYGYLEEYIESLLRAYVFGLNNIIPKYTDLPESITKNQIDLSFRLISRIERSRYRSVITPSQLIANLYSCVTNAEKYRINAEAFTHHSANFRSDTIRESFAQIGINGIPDKIIKCDIFKEYLQAVFPGRNVTKIRPHEAFMFLDDLAERRNEVSHGMPPDDILSNDLLLEYIKFFDIYGKALYEVIRNESLQYSLKYNGIELGTPMSVFKDGRVVCISIKKTTIKEGDMLIAKTSDPNRPYLAGEIQELQVNNMRCSEVKPEADVGILVPFKAKISYLFYLLPH